MNLHYNTQVTFLKSVTCVTYMCEIYTIRLLKQAKDNSFVLEEKAPHFTDFSKSNTEFYKK